MRAILHLIVHSSWCAGVVDAPLDAYQATERTVLSWSLAITEQNAPRGVRQECAIADLIQRNASHSVDQVTQALATSSWAQLHMGIYTISPEVEFIWIRGRWGRSPRQDRTQPNHCRCGTCLQGLREIDR